MNKQENDNQTSIEDLPVDEARQDEVKGGPTQVRSTEISGAVWSGVYDR